MHPPQNTSVLLTTRHCRVSDTVQVMLARQHNALREHCHITATPTTPYSTALHSAVLYTYPKCSVSGEKIASQYSRTLSNCSSTLSPRFGSDVGTEPSSVFTNSPRTVLQPEQTAEQDTAPPLPCTSRTTWGVIAESQ
jgi:hypothetical protein